MKTVKIADLKDQLSKYLRHVEQGHEIIVTDRSRPVARLVPFARATVLPLRAPTADLAALRGKKRSRANWQVRSDLLLAEEREER